MPRHRPTRPLCSCVFLLTFGTLGLASGCSGARPTQNDLDTDGTPDGPAPPKYEGLNGFTPEPPTTPPTDSDACGLAEVIGALPIELAANTAWHSKDFEPSCAHSEADIQLMWTAPNAGYFGFSTRGSEIDTVLSLHRPTCGGQQLACNDNAGGGPQPNASEVQFSELTMRMYEGQAVAIAIGGVGNTQGPVRLSIQERDCPAAHTLSGPLPLLVQGAASGPSQIHGSCGGAMGGESVYAWTAPYDGVFVASTQGSAADTVLYALHQTCPGAELVCADDSVETLQSDIVLTLSQGETVHIVVDTWAPTSASYQLTLRDALAP